jgi:type II secretory pathway component PulF
MASHQQLAHWYNRLGQQMEAGVTLAEALRFCDGVPAAGREAMAQQIESGEAIEKVLKDAPRWLPQPDRLFLVAAMRTGHLPQTLKNLAERHNRFGATQLKVILGLIYPIGVFHAAALLLPLTRMIDYEAGFLWDASSYATQALLFLAPVWAIFISIYLLAQSQSPLLSRILRCLPLLGRYSWMQAMADLSYALGTFIHAGVPAPAAWRLSVDLTGEPKFRRALQHLEPVFEQGLEPGSYLEDTPCFPEAFRSYYKAGVQSGYLDENMLRAGHQFQEQANQAMTFASILYPSLILFGVAALVIVNIFQVYGNYLKIFDHF